MAPKAKISKKTEQKVKQKIIEDKTFGLKNKKKSKTVQKYVEQVVKTVQTGGQRKSTTAQPDRKALKAAQKAAEEELKKLFAQALDVNPKNAGGGAKEDELVPVEVANRPKQEQKTIYIEEEARTLEDLIEEQRERFRAEGRSGTPITQESLAKWKADKAERRRVEAARKVQEELKKKGGKGLAVLSGKDLFSYNAALFVDDDEAIADEINERLHEIEEEGAPSSTENISHGNLESKDEEKEEKLEDAPPIEVTEILLEDEGSQIAIAVQEHLYLDGDDADLDDIEDSDEET